LEQLLGIDIGTSSVKGLIIEPNGRIVAHSFVEHNLNSPYPDWAEESTKVWWENTVKVIRILLDHPDVIPSSIAGIGVTGMVPALVILSEDGVPLRPAMMQTDGRASKEIEEIKANTPEAYFYSKTGASLSQQSIGPKLLWLQRNEPELWAQTNKVMGSYDYINLRLTDSYCIERNWALESGLYDINEGKWSPELLSLFKTPIDILPEIHDPSDVIGYVTKEVAKLTGLPSGIPVVAGTADHIGAAFASGIIDDGDLLIKFGSAGDILYSTGDLLVDPRLFIDYHIYPGKYMVNGCMSTSGSFIKWLVQQFFQEDITNAKIKGQSVYAYLDKLSEEIPPGSEGLIILPYFLGEKTPILDPNAKGVFFGMTLYHTRYHIYRAALESVVFGFRHHIKVLNERDRIPMRVVAGEGGARSKLWRQISADVLNMPVAYLKDNHGASLAAAFVAGIGVDIFQSWRDIERFVDIQDITKPIPDNVSIYDRCFERYLELYESLKEEFKKIYRA
jgi:xylulokinase